MEKNHNRVMKAAKQETLDLKSQVDMLTSENANLKNRLEQQNAYLASILKTSLPVVNAGPTIPPSPTFAGQCPACGSPEICSCY
jgi:hypothetical protein